MKNDPGETAMLDWEELQRRWRPLVWGTVYRILKDHDQALDCCQDVFLEAFERSQQRPVEDWAGFLRWLAVRRALDWLRKRRRKAAHFNRDTDIASIGGGEPCDHAQFHELVERVRLELARLPHRQAEAFWLCCVEEASYSDAARQLGTNANTIGVLVHRARARLRQLLTDISPSHVGS